MERAIFSYRSGVRESSSNSWISSSVKWEEAELVWSISVAMPTALT